jgi:hypothetical protein
MHHLSAAQKTKLVSHKRAYDHFLKSQKVLLGYARMAAAMSLVYPELNEASRIDLVKTLILHLDKSVWGLEVSWMSAPELAEIYARGVVGHEGGS